MLSARNAPRLITTLHLYKLKKLQVPNPVVFKVLVHCCLVRAYNSLDNCSLYCQRF